MSNDETSGHKTGGRRTGGHKTTGGETAGGETAGERLAEGVWCLALPSRTLPPASTTNTFLLADNGVAMVVDPGFEDEESLDRVRAALEALAVRLVKAVLLTHTHGDHRAGLELLRRDFDDPAVYVHPAELPRLAEGRVGEIAAGRLQALSDGRTLTVGDMSLEALHTPGHSPGHLCFYMAEQGALLAGDLVAGAGSVWVGLPEGDMSAYLASLERIAELPGLTSLGPGHGPLVWKPSARIAEVRAHRLEREARIVASLDNPRSLDELLELVYGELSESLLSPARATLLAHLRKLMAEMRVVHLGEDETGPFVVRR